MINSVNKAEDAIDPRILANSALWQSERWNRATKKISASDTFLGSLRLGLKLIQLRRHYDVVYTVGVREAQMYGLLSSLFGSGNRPHVAAEVFLDEPAPHRLAWRIKRKLRRFALRNVQRLIVFSSAEREVYSRELELPLQRVALVLFHTNVLEPERTALGSYGFAAGRSLRDWKTFFAAIADIDYPFTVVADKASVAHLGRPANVTLYCDIPREKYLDLLRQARFVVIPLLTQTRSVGQVVVLEAAALGKPVVATNVIGTRDYITHGVNGLLAASGDAEDLAKNINLLIADDTLCQNLRDAAYTRVANEHTFDAFVARCFEVIDEARHEFRTPSNK